MDLALAQQFDAVCQRVSSGHIQHENLSNEDRLKLYALYSIINKGPNPPEPSPNKLLNPTSYSKWKVWKQTSQLQLTKSQAMQQYIDIINTTPSSSSLSTTFGRVASTGFDFPTEDNEEGDEVEKDIWYYASEGDIQGVKKCIYEQKIKINSMKDETNGGVTVLIIAVDRGQIDLVKYLIYKLKANVNEIDDDGMAALHYAVICEHLNIVHLLLKQGAKIHVHDRNGISPLDLSKQHDQIRSTLLNYHQHQCKSKSNWNFIIIGISLILFVLSFSLILSNHSSFFF